jgi:hypothetical protein
MPLLIVEHRKTARWRRGPADDMNNEVDSAEPFANRVGHSCAAFGCSNVRRDEEVGFRSFGGSSSSGSENPHTLRAQPRDHSQPDTLCAARDERPAALQL